MGNAKDETGKRYGRLVVCSRVANSRSGRARWLCKCDCGNTIVAAGTDLRRGRPRSCGCSRTINEVGNRYGKLAVVQQGSQTSCGKIAWVCRCDCGRETTVAGGDLRAGATTSCGCTQCVGHPLPHGEAAMGQLLGRYRIGAQKRGLSFELTRAQFCALTQQPCYYCGCPPSQVMHIERLNGDYIYNGIDRMDNSRGYEPDNCVPCCKWCNRAKLARTVEEFLLWNEQVYHKWHD